MTTLAGGGASGTASGSADGTGTAALFAGITTVVVVASGTGVVSTLFTPISVTSVATYSNGSTLVVAAASAGSAVLKTTYAVATALGVFTYNLSALCAVDGYYINLDVANGFSIRFNIGGDAPTPCTPAFSAYNSRGAVVQFLAVVRPQPRDRLALVFAAHARLAGAGALRRCPHCARCDNGRHRLPL